MAGRHRVLVAEPSGFSPKALTLLRDEAEVELRECDPEGLRRAFTEYDVVWVRLAHRVDRSCLEGDLRCRLIAVPTTGLDHIDLEACSERGVRVLSLRGETEFLRGISSTAELTLGLLLCLLRRIPQAFASVQSGRWDRYAFQGRELAGKTAGIVGVGRLGRMVAGYLSAFGVEVLGCDPRPDFPDEVATRVASLHEMLPRCDVVTLHVPLDPTTRDLIGAPELALMRPEAVLINTSRGGVVRSAALVAALRGGNLAGAALDVLDGEPDVALDHPLIEYARQHENLLIVPHLGGFTHEALARAEEFLASRVVAALRS